jgi:hypothetical protein
MGRSRPEIKDLMAGNLIPLAGFGDMRPVAQ